MPTLISFHLYYAPLLPHTSPLDCCFLQQSADSFPRMSGDTTVSSRRGLLWLSSSTCHTTQCMTYIHTCDMHHTYHMFSICFCLRRFALLIFACWMGVEGKFSADNMPISTIYIYMTCQAKHNQAHHENVNDDDRIEVVEESWKSSWSARGSDMHA